MIKHRSPEWYKVRIGKFTASNFSDLMAQPADKNAAWSKSALSCIEKAALQLYLNKYDESPDCDATRWGLKHEQRAIQEFAQVAGFQCKEAGFVLHPDFPDVGATPDTIVIENEQFDRLVIAQIKCPYNQNIHAGYLGRIKDNLSLKKCKSQYYWQIQGEIWVTNALHSYFVSFDPRISGSERLHFVKIERDEDAIGQLGRIVEKSIRLRDEILDEFRTQKRKSAPPVDFGFRRKSGRSVWRI